MTSISLQCTFPGCTYATEKIEVAGAAALLSNHSLQHQQTQSYAAPAQSVVNRAPKLERPKVKSNITTEEWNAFYQRWTNYQSGSIISDNIASSQFLECATGDLGDIVLRAHPDFTSKPISDATELLKALAVVPVTLGVTRSQFASGEGYSGCEKICISRLWTCVFWYGFCNIVVL